ncbi:tetraspanin-8-like [Cololabis saira]|uniref:tetraspanin-8-like n=1 Tax=Cololabis saira TaxID=129043 RepID=UPI002AD372B9|nr:tetraspanin-8-like [Cololabis saira]
MGKVNIWLRRSFMGVTSVMAIVSLLLLGMTLFGHGLMYRDEEVEEATKGLHFLYGISVVILFFAILGGFGAYKEKKWALIVFAAAMILSSLFVIVTGSFGLAAKHQIGDEIKKQYLNLLPLPNSTENVLDAFSEAQIEFQCCGLEQGYTDWGDSIPESCLCTEGSTNACVAAPRNSNLRKDATDDQPVLIFAKACLPYFIEHDISFIQIVFGTMLGYTLLWVLSVVLCIAILCQLNVKEETPTVVYSKEAKAGNYTSLTETLN